MAEEYESHFSRLQDALDFWVIAFSVALVALGAWWGIVAVVSLIFGRMAAVLFRPFADLYKAIWAILLLAIGVGLMVLSAGFGLAYYSYFT